MDSEPKLRSLHGAFKGFHHLQASAAAAMVQAAYAGIHQELGLSRQFWERFVFSLCAMPQCVCHTSVCWECPFAARL